VAQNYVYLGYVGSDRRFPVCFLLLLYVMTLRGRIKLTIDCSFTTHTSQMEFPSDILGLIREYSKPAFKYFREYNRALKVLDKEEWKSLRDKLMTDGESVVPTLLLYLDAWIELQKTQVIHWDYYRGHLMKFTLYGPNIMNELNRLTDDVQFKTNHVKTIYRKLVVQIYGKSLPECVLYGYD